MIATPHTKVAILLSMDAGFILKPTKKLLKKGYTKSQSYFQWMRVSYSGYERITNNFYLVAILLSMDAGFILTTKS